MSKGLKINNNNSSVAEPKKNNADALNEVAQGVKLKLDEYKQRTWDLSNKFKALVEDRFLIENKSPIAKDLEKEVLDGLVLLASEMNADEYQPEGFGNIAINYMLMKMILLQRDRLNALEHKVEKLTKPNDNA
jgi:hypothetical protein